MNKDNKTSLNNRHGAHNQPQRDILAMFIRFIFNSVLLAALIIIGLSFFAACQPRTVVENSSVEGRP